MMRYIIANWKMNMNLKDLEVWFDKFDKLIARKGFDQKIVLAPAFVHLPLVIKYAENYGLEVSTQDVSIYKKGAYTGDVGAFQIKDFCHYCIVGHSERNETTENVLKKVDLCLEDKVIPIVCFKNPKEACTFYKKETILVWEDPQNISKDGVYRAEDPTTITFTIKEIRSSLPREAILLYGGSVNRKNVRALSAIAELDGVLVGNASLNPEHFLEIINAF